MATQQLFDSSGLEEFREESLLRLAINQAKNCTRNGKLNLC